MNKKDKTQLAITGVLVGILVVILALGAGKSGKKRKKRKPVSRAAVSVSAPGSSAAKPSAKLSPFRQMQAEAERMPLVRDPFTLKPIEGDEEDQSGVVQEVKLYLIGIAWDPVQPKAIINDKIVQVGSQLDRYTVLEITQDKVVLSDGTEKFELLLEL